MDLANLRKISLWFGVVYLIIGVLGFIPGITIPSTRADGMAGEGLLLGIFAVNTLHNIAHLVIGAALVWTGTAAPDPRLANRILAGLFLLLFIGSFIAPVVEGVALNPPDSILHLASALLTGYLGFASNRSLPSRVYTTRCSHRTSKAGGGSARTGVFPDPGARRRFPAERETMGSPFTLGTGAGVVFFGLATPERRNALGRTKNALVLHARPAPLTLTAWMSVRWLA